MPWKRVLLLPLLIPIALSIDVFEPRCTSTEDFAWPRYETPEELAADSGWHKYFTMVYGESMPLEAFPLCVYDMHLLNVTAYFAAGLGGTRPVVTNTSELEEGDMFMSIAPEGFGIYHEEWTPLPNNSWFELAHMVYPTELDGMWMWRTRGSGVWANVGRTIVFPTPEDPSQTHAEAIAFLSDGCSKTPSKFWPQLESDVFGFCAREKGYDSVQFEPQDGESPTGTFGLPGATEIVLTNLQGDLNCGALNESETLLRSGWAAASMCACVNEPIDPYCGLMAYPPTGLPDVMVHPKLCEAQKENASVACLGQRCLPTTCSVY